MWTILLVSGGISVAATGILWYVCNPWKAKSSAGASWRIATIYFGTAAAIGLGVFASLCMLAGKYLA